MHWFTGCLNFPFFVPPDIGNKSQQTDDSYPYQACSKPVIVFPQISYQNRKGQNPRHGRSNKTPVTHVQNSSYETYRIIGKKWGNTRYKNRPKTIVTYKTLYFFL